MLIADTKFTTDRGNITFTYDNQKIIAGISRASIKWRFTLLAFTATIATKFVSLLSSVTIVYIY
ncbi:MAG TPA: hypothetical protein VE619_04925 [Nitrososphaeraceae archaeon]|nr:hypothetical protein [Nitrososphaeraceae archaeon]